MFVKKKKKEEGRRKKEKEEKKKKKKKKIKKISFRLKNKNKNTTTAQTNKLLLHSPNSGTCTPCSITTVKRSSVQQYRSTCSGSNG